MNRSEDVLTGCPFEQYGRDEPGPELAHGDDADDGGSGAGLGGRGPRSSLPPLNPINSLSSNWPIAMGVWIQGSGLLESKVS